MAEVSTIVLPNQESAIALSGEHEENLKSFARQTGATLVLRGQELYISGTDKQIQLCSQLVRSLEDLWGKGKSISSADILTARQALDTHRQDELQELQRDILTRTRSTNPQTRPHLLHWACWYGQNLSCCYGCGSSTASESIRTLDLNSSRSGSRGKTRLFTRRLTTENRSLSPSPLRCLI